MAFPSLKAVHFIGLALLLGGPAFWYWISGQRGRPGAPGALGWTAWALGLSAFVATGVLDAARAAADLWGPVTAADVAEFLINARFGRNVLIRSALAVVFCAVAWRRPTTRPAKLVLIVLAGGVIVSVSLTGHAASSGWLGLLADVVHVAAVAAWGGALVHFALAWWDGESATSSAGAHPRAGRVAPLAVQARRFARLGTVAVAALVATGVLMASRLMFGLPALTATPYGGALLVKVGVFAALLAVAAANHFLFVPALQSGRQARATVTPFRWAVQAEAALLLLVLGATGVLTTGTPPREAQVIAAPIRETGFIGSVAYDLQVAPQDTGSLVFTLRLEDAGGRPVTIPPPAMELTMPDHAMPPYYATLRPAEPGVYRAELILPMSGRWRVFIYPEGLGGGRESVAVELRAMDSPREAQQVWYFTWYRAIRWPSGPLWLLIYVGLAVFAVRAVRIAGRRPDFALLKWAAYMLLAVSMWQVVSTFVAKGYPTADRPNPVPATAAAVARGAELFQAHCGLCHGPAGRGDGPLAAEMWPPPSDLTVFGPMHTDGELFWFISKGVPGTDMPAFEALLSDEERWTVVHYVRSLVLAESAPMGSHR